MTRQQCAFLEESSKFKGCGEKELKKKNTRQRDKLPGVLQGMLQDA